MGAPHVPDGVQASCNTLRPSYECHHAGLLRDSAVDLGHDRHQDLRGAVAPSRQEQPALEGFSLGNHSSARRLLHSQHYLLVPNMPTSKLAFATRTELIRANPVLVGRMVGFQSPEFRPVYRRQHCSYHIRGRIGYQRGDRPLLVTEPSHISIATAPAR